MSRPTWDEMKARADGGLLPRKAEEPAGAKMLRSERRSLWSEVWDIDRRSADLEEERGEKIRRIGEIDEFLGDDETFTL